jgi:hypothetical protein
MLSEPCPRCGKDTTVTGSVHLPADKVFQPDGIRLLEHFLKRLGQPTVIRLLGPYRACLDCGLVWNTLSPDELREVIRREGIAIEVKEKEPEI